MLLDTGIYGTRQYLRVRGTCLMENVVDIIFIKNRPESLYLAFCLPQSHPEGESGATEMPSCCLVPRAGE